MRIPPPGYPCRVCGKMMQDTSEGQGFTAGKYKFVTCNACAPKVKNAVRIGASIVQTGLRALVQHKAPGVLPVLQQLHDAYTQAKQEPQ